MHPPLGSIQTLTPVHWPTPAAGVGQSQGTQGFQELLSRSWQDTHKLTSSAEATIESGLVNEDLSMVETFTAMREADVALRLMLQVRNKLVDAYQELQQIRF